MIRHGQTSTGRQRWRCKPCKITTLNEIDSTAKHLDEFVAWLLGRRRQADLPGYRTLRVAGRVTFRCVGAGKSVF